MKQIRLNVPGVILRVIDKDISGPLFHHLVEIVNQQCLQMFPLPPSASFISESMPGTGWYTISSTDVKTSVIVAEYDPGTYVRFVLQGLCMETLFIVYRIETGRIPLDARIWNVTINQAPTLATEAADLPESESQLGITSPDFKAAVESLYKMQEDSCVSASLNWPQEQLDKLRMAVEKYGRRWKLIVSKFDFGELSSQDLCCKWNELLKAGQVSGRQDKSAKGTANANRSRARSVRPFTTRDSAQLCQAVAEHGQNWDAIAKLYHFNGRDGAELKSIWDQLQNNTGDYHN